MSKAKDEAKRINAQATRDAVLALIAKRPIDFQTLVAWTRLRPGAVSTAVQQLMQAGLVQQTREVTRHHKSGVYKLTVGEPWHCSRCGRIYGVPHRLGLCRVCVSLVSIKRASPRKASRASSDFVPGFGCPICADLPHRRGEHRLDVDGVCHNCGESYAAEEALDIHSFMFRHFERHVSCWAVEL